MIKWHSLDTPGRIAAIREYLAKKANATTQEMGEAFGCTRNAVLGVIKRHKIEWERLGRKGARLGIKHKPKRRNIQFGNPLNYSPAPTPPVQTKGSRPLPGTMSKRLEDIVVGVECRWPVGEDPTTMCGCPVDPADLDGGGRARYCTTHAAMSGVRLPALAAIKRTKEDGVAQKRMTSGVDAEFEAA